MQLLPRHASAGFAEEAAPLHVAVDGIERESRHVEAQLGGPGRIRPVLAVAQEALESVGGLEEDALDGMGEIALRLVGHLRPAQEFDLVIEQ